MDDINAENARIRAEAMSPSLPPTNEGTPFSVSSDSQASYRLVTWSPMPNGHIQALTRRDGPSGTSFARREIDCDGRLFRYLGEGDTREQAMRDSPNIGEMSDLVPDSIADVTVRVVCEKAHR